MKKSGKLFFGICLLAGAAGSAMAQYGPPPPAPGAQYGAPVQGGNPWRYNGGPGRWDPSWDRRPDPSRGACFYTDRGFTGHHFCVSAGDRIAQLPGDIGDNISSIQTFGGARVRVFDDRNFQGMNAVFGRSVPELQRVPSRPGHTWNNRISSVAVR